MVSKNDLLPDLLDTSSSFFSRSWPAVVVTSLEILQHYKGRLFARPGPKLVRVSAPPYELVFNLALHDAENHESGELAFLQDVQKVAWLNFLQGPDAMLAVRLDDAT